MAFVHEASVLCVWLLYSVFLGVQLGDRIYVCIYFWGTFFAQGSLLSLSTLVVDLGGGPNAHACNFIRLVTGKILLDQS